MKIAVIGAGAIGGWLTAGLIEAGCAPIVLARGASLDALRRDGLTLDDGTRAKTYPVHATDDPGDLVGADLLLLGLKAHDLSGARSLIAPALGPNTIVVPAINGLPWWFFDGFGGPAEGLRLQNVDPGGLLSDLIPPNQIVGSVIHAASYVAAPGRIRLVRGDQVYLGDVAQGQHAKQVADLMAAGGLPAIVSDTIRWNVWNKLWSNANLNPLSALTRGDIQQMAHDPYVMDFIVQMMREQSDLAALIGLEGFDDMSERIALVRDFGPFKTSTLQDIEAGRPIEIDPILGGLVELAAHLGHPTPALDAVYGMTRMLDRNLRGVDDGT